MLGKDKSYDWQRPGRGNSLSVISGREGKNTPQPIFVIVHLPGTWL